MMQPQHIDRDIYCECGYNLRGLTPEHKCPECGRAVRAALGIRHDASALEEMQQMHRDRAVRDGLVSAAMQTEESIDAVFFVLRAQQFASFRRGGGDISARQLCAAVRDYARATFGGENEAILGLAKLRLRSSERVGRIVLALVKARLLRKSEHESIKDFVGLFTLNDLFSVDL